MYKRKLTPFTVLKAATTIIVFGIPLVVGTTTLLGYGILRALKRLKPK